MKTIVKIVNVIILILNIIMLMTILYMDYGFDLFKFTAGIPLVDSNFILMVDFLLIIFLTTTLLVSPQLIIKHSLELNELTMKDKLLKTKLTVLKKEKELLEIQKDIDNLKSVGKSKDI